MGQATWRRWASAAAGVLVAGATAAMVGAWHPTGQEPFTLPPATGSNPPVWMPTKGPQRVAVRVTTSGGKTKVKAGSSPSVNVQLGMVPSGTSAVFEGDYGFLNVEADASGTATGNWEARTLGLPSDGDQIIGQGSVTLPIAGGSTQFHYFGGDASRCRLTTVQASATQPVTVIDGQGNTLVSLEAGDWTCCVRTTLKYGLSGQGTAAWVVADVPTGPAAYAWQYGGTASAQPGDTGDALSLDGSGAVRVTLQNTSTSGTIIVTSTGGSQPNPSSVGPGQSTTCAGTLTGFSWTYAQPGMTAGIVVRKE